MKRYLIIIGVLFSIAIGYFLVFNFNNKLVAKLKSTELHDSAWVAPSLFLDVTTQGEERKLVIYGQELIAHTAKYFGPNGLLTKTTNGMNCQNCHLSAGTKPWGNNFGAVYSTYPKYRARSGTKESIYKRIFDCMERSLNGKGIDSSSREFKAIYAYIKWLGAKAPDSNVMKSIGIEKLPYLNRAANPITGKKIYTSQCRNCHGDNGEGVLDAIKMEYVYPPLWGPNSYNDGAGLYRLSNFAGFVKNNMPYLKASHQSPLLTNEAAWDVAAFVNSQSRPHKNQMNDWPVLKEKPIDYPFEPFFDKFPASQHKFGPYLPIQGFYQQMKNDKSSIHYK